MSNEAKGLTFSEIFILPRMHCLVNTLILLPTQSSCPVNRQALYAIQVLLVVGARVLLSHIRYLPSLLFVRS